MRCLLLFPPQWISFSPHLAGPAIHGILKNSGHATRLLDLNAAFYNTVLAPEYLYAAVKAAFADFEANAPGMFEACPDEAGLKHHPRDFQARYKRYRAILKMARRDEYRASSGRSAAPPRSCAIARPFTIQRRWTQPAASSARPARYCPLSIILRRSIS